MIDKFRLTKTSTLAFVTSCAVAGVLFMSVIDTKAADKNVQASEIIGTPTAGMTTVLDSYVETSEGHLVEFLSTTAVADGEDSNEYITESGRSEGKYIVCAAESYTPVYSEQEESEDLVVAKLYTNGVATLISIDGEWCRIVTGDIEGYVKTSDFVFGEEAQALDASTYETKALINIEGLNMYSEMSTGSTVMCVLSSGFEYKVTEADTGTGYTKIYVSGVGEGYIETVGILTATNHIYGISVEDEELNAASVSQGIEKAAQIEAEKAAAAAAAKAAEEQAKREAEEAAKAAAEAAAKEAAAKAAAQAAAAKAAAQAAAVQQAQANAVALAGTGEVASIRQAVVNYACTFVGWLPYVHGGASLTTGADCSGFTSAVFAKFGYSLSRSSSAQSCQGRSVSLSEITIGDIVVYSGHVAIYIGNGQVVHSPRPGRTVSIDSINMMTVLDVRRIIE